MCKSCFREWASVWTIKQICVSRKLCMHRCRGLSYNIFDTRCEWLYIQFLTTIHGSGARDVCLSLVFRKRANRRFVCIWAYQERTTAYPCWQRWQYRHAFAYRRASPYGMNDGVLLTKISSTFCFPFHFFDFPVFIRTQRRGRKTKLKPEAFFETNKKHQKPNWNQKGLGYRSVLSLSWPEEGFFSYPRSW